MRIITLFVFSLLCSIVVSAQYVDGSSVKYGNEWIDYDAEYYKLTLDEDGIYRVTRDELSDMGFPVTTVNMSQFSLFNFGEEVEIYTSGEGIMTDSDYIEFYGTRNRNEIDQYSFENKQHQLNTEYSLITDTNAYFLSYGTGIQKRYDALDTEFSTNLPPLEQYYIAEYEKLYTTGFSKEVVQAVRYSSSKNTEGYGSGLKKTLSFTASLPNLYSNGPDPSIELRFGSNAVEHNIAVQVDGSQVKNYLFNGYRVTQDEFTFDKSMLKTSLPVKLNATGGSSDRFNLAYLRIKYAAEFNFDGNNFARLRFDDSPFDRYLELKNFQTNTGTPVFYDINTKRRITSVVEGEIVKIQFEGSLLPNDFVVVTDGSVKTIAQSEKVEFVDFSSLNAEYLILSHPDLFEDEDTGSNYVQEYADYRASAAGGAFDVRIVDITDIYETFGYGIEGHFLSVKSFVNWANTNWSDLSYLFIIGKGREYATYRSQAQKDADPIFHVPTFGYPGSDNLLASPWGKTAPLIPSGRLAAKNTKDIDAYLKKVIEHEAQKNNPQTIEGKLWMKRVLHLSGGDSFIQGQIRNMLSNMGDVLETTSFGGDITTFYKTSSDPIENSQSEAVREIINNGVSILTFFGHSAVGVFDLSLENVNVYENKGKYPLLLSLGCHSGNVHTASFGLSEEFVLAEDKGSIAFIASSSEAYIPNQYNYGLDLYKIIGDNLNTLAIGDALVSVYEIYDNSVGYAWETLLEQLTLHGDPAIRLHSSDSEDYTPDFTTAQHSPEIINAFQDSFNICFDVANLGLYVDTTISINVQHLNPAGEVLIDTSFTSRTPSFVENYCINLPLTSTDVVGKNSIKVYVDDKEQYIELPDPSAEGNNSFVNTAGGDTYDFFILNNGAEPVEPKNYSIYNQEVVTLRASSFNALGEKQTFVFQLDTIESFDSPFMTEQLFQESTGLMSWSPAINFENNTVYYWRVSPDTNTSGQERVWNSSSFTYLPNSSPGWSQSHVDQYLDNELNEFNIVDGKLDYVSNFRDIRVINRVSIGENFANFFINNGFWGNAYYINKGSLIGVVVADELGKFDRNNSLGKYGSLQPNNENCLAFYFDPNDQQSRINLVNFLENDIEDNNYVFFYTVHNKNDFNPTFSNLEWESDADLNDGKNIFTVLKDQGATIIDSLKTQSITPYNFFYQKNKEALCEDLAQDIEGKADCTTPMFGKWFTGTEKSVTIGPSTRWRKLVWSEEKSSIAANDSSYVRLYGVLEDGRDTLLQDYIYDTELNLAPISAEQFPFLKLEYFTFDNINLSTPDLTYWRVFFDGIPELALDILDEGAIFKNDTLDQGNEFVLRIPLVNIGQEDVDSVDVKITLTDENNAETVINKTLSTIEAGDKKYIEFSVATNDFVGDYVVTVEANTRKMPEECFYFNNFGLRTFTVLQDVRNPLLDVSFDGRRIMNGDIVSAEPIIRIVTKDENEFLLLDDTTSYVVKLYDPNGISTTIPMSSPDVVFSPATSAENNESEIIFTPTLEQDGIYTLSVSSKDVTGNVSGSKDFEVDFEVINEELISNVFNYPNPFSDCTQFVFTLTGNEMPQDISIRIMTISGKVVKEIGGLELGPLNIGVNRTEYKWDGTDEYGSKLANGVYLYQVTTTKQSGDFYEKYDTNTDNYFKNNIGKLVIIR